MKKTLRVITFKFDTVQRENDFDWDKFVSYIYDTVIAFTEFLGLELFMEAYPETYEDDDNG